MAEPTKTDEPELTVSHADLKGRGRPAGWTVERHADHDATGMLVVTAPPAIAGLGLLPGQQINYRRDDDGNVVAYGVGPHENAGEAGLHITPVGAGEDAEVDEAREITPGEPTPESTTPQPQAASTPHTPLPQASSTDQLVRLQDQSNTSPGGIGLDDQAAADLAVAAVVDATDEGELDRLEQPDATVVTGPAPGEGGTTYPIAGDNGWYELSDGNKVRGQEAAEKAQAKLDKKG